MAITSKHDVQLLLAAAFEACDERKAEDIRILALDPSESGLTDYFLICSGNSDRQNVAITDAIEIKLKQEFGIYPTSVEGRRLGEWILMDYVDFIVHVFSTEKRAYYGLERLRKTATVLSIEDLNAEIKSTITETRKKSSARTRPAPVGKKTLLPNKTAAKKSPAEGAAAKNSSTKIIAAKSAKKAPAPAVKAVKKAAAKKTVIKKVAGKRVVAKKATPKKASPKKPSGKK